MFKIFEDRVRMNGEDVCRLYPGKGSIMTNIKERKSDRGVILQCSGELHAICDEDGLDELLEEVNRIRKLGVSTMLDTVSLEDSENIYTEE